MRLRIYQCPACGYSLKVEIGTTSIQCPACGSTIMVEPEEYTEQCSSGVKMITDPVSGQAIASAKIPAKWTASGEINQTMQSMSNPFTAQVKITSPDGNTVLFANTGESFQQLKQEPMQRHQEGGFNQNTKMPMRRFQMPGEYLDVIAQNMAMGREIRVLQTGQLPSAYGCDLQDEKQKVLQEAAAMERNASMSGIQVKVQNVFTDALMKIYQIGEQIVILGADMGGLEYAMYAPGMGMMGLGLTGAMSGLKQGKEILSGMTDMFGRNRSGDSDSEDEYRGAWGFFKGGGLVGAMARKKNQERRECAASSYGVFGENNTDRNADDRNTSSGAGLFGTASTAGALYAYADWGSKSVYGLITEIPYAQTGQKVFEEFVHSFRFDPSIPARMKAMTQEMGRQGMVAQQQAFAAQQQTYRTMQAAYDRQNQAWWDRHNQTYEHQRSAWQNHMDAQDRMSEKWSEVNRGENIYIRPDGSETTYSNSADRVFMKNGDPQTMRSASKGEEVPYGWSELKRKW